MKKMAEMHYCPIFGHIFNKLYIFPENRI